MSNMQWWIRKTYCDRHIRALYQCNLPLNCGLRSSKHKYFPQF